MPAVAGNDHEIFVGLRFGGRRRLGQHFGFDALALAVVAVEPAGECGSLGRIARTQQPHAEIRLADARELEDSLSFDTGSPRITSIGRWTVGKVVDLLIRGEPAQVANPIKFEAIGAAEEIGLPAPTISIESQNEFDDHSFSLS